MMYRTLVIMCCLFLFACPVQNGVAGEEKTARVMVLPFDGTASGDFAYLTDSIRAMVLSRLAANKDVELVDYAVQQDEIRMLNNGAATLEDGESLFTRFQTDYVVTGGLYALQTGLKIQVSVKGKDEEAPPVRLQVLAVNEDAIIPQVEMLAGDIAGKGMGLQTAGPASVAGKAEGAEEGLAGFATEHPEKVYKKGIFSGSIVVEEGGGVKVASTAVRRSSVIPSMLVTMATGDLNGDGRLEIASASRSTLSIYRFNETRFEAVAEHRFSGAFKIHAVNIADVDRDGRQEIFVSADRDGRAASAIVKLDGSSLVPVLEEIEWYIRPLNKPGEGVILAGQRASQDPKDGYVRQGVSQLKLYANFNGVREDKKLPLPRNVRLFDFEWVDLDNDNKYELIAVDHREKLLIYDSQNSLMWVSEEDYGGSRNFFGPPKSSRVRSLMAFDDDSEFEREMVFLPTRILPVDVDGDGRQEIVIGQNKRLFGKWLSNSREYDGGAVVCLGWQENGLRQLWKTNKINGYIADYNYVQNGRSLGSEEDASAGLYVAQIPEKMFFGFLMSSESKLLRYDLVVEAAD
ncbi:VCBS repeat-containing protein [Desulfopila sp. IMCC35008]|uniref:FG-GAP repeat domain-containing protein n=1 Tax=Desulfopila sp. IMCC35008 TaxID=2653858 RepID=UPI0013D55D8E|nr:VCBS repeat-containing protein [Desulfopila sp. IMCC35008]